MSEVRAAAEVLPEQELDDRALVLEFQAGTATAFSAIYRRYRPLAGSVCQRILGNREDAEEAAQETMLRVLQGLPRFNGRYQLAAWVARIATNVSYDAIRAKARRPQNGASVADLDELRPSGTEDPLELVERMLERERVRAVLEELPAHHREALVLREFEGRSHQEIGERLGVTPAQAKALIHRAKGTFRRVWDGDGTRRGIAALLPPFLFFPLKVPGFLRRLFQPAQEAASTAGSGVAQATTTVASSPAVLASAPGIAERLTATAVTVLVVGSVGVGAVVIKDRKPEREPKAPSPTQSVAAPAPVIAFEPKPEKARGPAAAERDRGKEQRPAAEDKSQPSPSPSSEPSPSVSPETSPVPTTPPPPPPAPPWELSFEAWPGLRAGSFALISSSVQGAAGKEIRFHQVVAAPTVDREGNTVGRLYVEYWGRAEGALGDVTFWIFLDRPEGRYAFEASGTLSAVTVAEDGTSSYVFEADLDLEEAPEDVLSAVPEQGSISLALDFWVDGRSLYAAELALVEAPPAA